MDGYILSIDQGTSGSKAIIFDHSGRIIASAFHEVVQYFPQPGWVEQDANEIWAKTILAVKEVLINARILPEDICAIGISSQRATSVVWNKFTGEPYGRAIIWQDRRTQQICDRLPFEDREKIIELTGLVMVPNMSSTKIQWLMEEDRTVKKAIARGELLFGTIDSWLIWKLSGGVVHVTDYSNASTTGLFNAAELKYDDWILNKLEIPCDILPEIKSSSEVYAYTDPRVFFDVKIPISGCIGDQPAAAFGQACLEPGMTKNTYGTGSFMILNTGRNHSEQVGGVISPVMWNINGETTYGLEGFADVSGAVIQWLQDGLGILRDVNEADGLAMQVPDTRGVYFVPALVGLGAPHFSPNAKGTIFGISLATNKNHIARAAIESMAYQTRDSLACIEQAYGVRCKSLRVDGGGAKSDFLVQFQADILGIPIEKPVVIETSALGAAYLAGLAIGFWQSIEEVASYWKLETRFEPRISESKRENLYSGWLQAVECAKSWGANKIPGSEKPKSDNRLELLSPREREVVTYYSSGKSMHEISTLLFTSLKTVEKQRRDAMRKLGVENLVDLIRICLELGLITENNKHLGNISKI